MLVQGKKPETTFGLKILGCIQDFFFPKKVSRMITLPEPLYQKSLCQMESETLSVKDQKWRMLQKNLRLWRKFPSKKFGGAASLTFRREKIQTKFFWTKKGPKTYQKNFQRQDLPRSTAKELKVGKTRKKRIKFAYPVERKNAKLKLS